MKTIFKASLLAVAILLCMNIKAQEAQAGIKGGINLSNFSGDAENTDSKIGFHVGVTFDYALSSDVYLLTGLNLTTKGCKSDVDIYSGGYYNYYQGTETMTINPIYLELPIHIGYKLDIAEKTKIVFHAGPYLAYGVGGKAKLGDEESNVFSSNGFKEFDFGFGVGTGVEFGKISVGLGYDFGFINIVDNSNEGKLKNQNAYLTVGHKF